MSLKQFPAHGTFSKARDEFNQKQDKPPPPPEPRSVATVFDVEDAWEMLDKRQQHEKKTNFKLGDHEKLDAARIAAAAGIKVGLHHNTLPQPRPETLPPMEPQTSPPDPSPQRKALWRERQGVLAPSHHPKVALDGGMISWASSVESMENQTNWILVAESPGDEHWHESPSSSPYQVTANFSVAQAVEKYRMEKLREMLIYCVFLIFFTVSVIHNRMVPERGMLLSSIKGAYMDNRFITTDGSAPPLPPPLFQLVIFILKSSTRERQKAHRRSTCTWHDSGN
jgi:hypothetical protein